VKEGVVDAPISNVTVVVSVNGLELPVPATDAVIVIGYVPAGALVEVAMARLVAVAELVGVKLAVTPAGRPDALKVAVPVKPPTGVIVSASVADCPGVRESLLAAALKVNAAWGVTLRLRAADAVAVPDVPVIVSG
jgi:hypothetical protein